MPLPNIPKEMLCQARSKRTGLPCKNVKAYSCNVCRMHGAHRPQKAPCGEDHWNYQHGKATKKRRAEDAASATKLLLLRDLGNRLGMFGDQLTGLPGRRPKGYPLGEQMSAEDMIAMINAIDSGGKDGPLES